MVLIPVKVAPTLILGSLALTLLKKFPPVRRWPSLPRSLLGGFFELWLSKKTLRKAIGQAAITLMEASTWTQKEFHVTFFVPMIPKEIPRTRAIATMNKLKQTTTAMLSFRYMLKVAVRSTMTGMDITRTNQRRFCECVRGLRITSVTISDTTEKYRKPRWRRMNAGLELQSSGSLWVRYFLC